METKRATASFLEYCGYRGLRPKTLEFYAWGLDYLERAYEVLPKHRREIVSILGANPLLGQESRRCLHRIFRRFFGWVAEEFHQVNPTLHLEPLPKFKSVSRVLSPEEIEVVWEACESGRERGMVAVVLDTGIRLGEVASLTRRDIGTETLRVTGKVGSRLVPLSRSVRDMLLSLAGDSRHVWKGRKGNLGRIGIQKAYRRLFRRAGLTGPKLGPHLLRHTFGTHYCRAGGNVRILQEIMGHQSLNTTMIYVHLAGRAVIEDHAVYSPIKTLALVK